MRSKDSDPLIADPLIRETLFPSVPQFLRGSVAPREECSLFKVARKTKPSHPPLLRAFA